MSHRAWRASPWTRAALPVAAGVGLLLLLLAAYGHGELLGILRGARPRPLFLAFALFCLQIPLLSLRWWWLLRLLEVRVRFIDILAAHCGAAVTNFIAPGHLGEVALSTWLERTGRAPGVEAFTTLVLCKSLTLLISLAMLFVGLLGSDAPGLRPLRIPALIALILGLVLCAVALGAGADPAEGTTGVWRLLGRARATLQDLRRSPRALAVGFVLTAANAFLLCSVLGLVYQSVGVPLGAVDTLLLRGVDTIGHGLAGWVPANLGVDEAVMTLASHHALGIDGPLALGAALLHKSVVVGYVAVTGAIFLVLGLRR